MTNPIDIIYLKMYYYTYKCYMLYLSEFIGGHNTEQDLNKALKRTDFYSIADMLYQLNNFWMLSTFIHQNRQFLFNEVNDITSESGIPDFSVPCKLGQETLLSRVFRVMNSHSLNENIISENSSTYQINTHKLRIYSTTLRSNQPVPQIIIQGKWVEKWGFSIGCSVRIECYQNKLIILLDE